CRGLLLQTGSQKGMVKFACESSSQHVWNRCRVQGARDAVEHAAKIHHIPGGMMAGAKRERRNSRVTCSWNHSGRRLLIPAFMKAWQRWLISSASSKRCSPVIAL